ncbi:MAG: hypothetical protein BWX88_05094 [Planctomycetes bacterium ADurb.Bin126]|nr:MAG: hypothetical protein BWX88_05094 [Planctomycetes bacterium ADurb.Bin126]
MTMKAVTIANPYPYLIALPTIHPYAKRCENRTWPTSYRGWLAIHAGKSRQWMETWEHVDEIDDRDLHWGAIVAIVRVIECLHIDQVRAIGQGAPSRGLEWAKEHMHCSGPYCWLFAPQVIRVEPPIPCSGAQGLWTPDASVQMRLAAHVQEVAT